MGSYILEFNDSRKRWELNKRGASRAIRTAEQLRNIESEARRIARNNNATLRIERINGGTRERADYS